MSDGVYYGSLLYCGAVPHFNLDDLQPRDDDRSDMARTGANIARLRKEKGLSQSALARAMQESGHDWHQNTVSRIENGKQDLNIAELEDLGKIIGNFLDGTQFAESLRRLADTFLDRWMIGRVREAEEAVARAAEALSQLHRVMDAQLRREPHVREVEPPEAPALSDKEAEGWPVWSVSSSGGLVLTDA